MEAESFARALHEEYERLAPEYGWETQAASRRPWEQVPTNNRNLMVAATEAAIERCGGAPGLGTLAFPTINGSLEITVGSGRCHIEGCKMRGGGFIKFVVEDEIADGVASIGQPLVICPKHLALVLRSVFEPVPKDGD